MNDVHYQFNARSSSSTQTSFSSCGCPIHLFEGWMDGWMMSSFPVAFDFPSIDGKHVDKGTRFVRCTSFDASARWYACGSHPMERRNALRRWNLAEWHGISTFGFVPWENDHDSMGWKRWMQCYHVMAFLRNGW